MADSIRDALTSAFAAAEEEANTEAGGTSTPEPTSTPNTSQDTTVGGGEPVNNEPAPTPASKPTAGQPAGKPATSAQQPAATPAERAPASWKAEEKAAWATVPPAARAAIMRREQETQRVLSVSADARRHQADFQAAIQPFMPLMEHHGIAPIPAITSLLQMRASLEVGTKEQKAQLVSNLVRQFGVDIEALDGFLAGSHGQRPETPAPRFDPRSVPEFAPLFQLAEQFTAAQSAKLDKQFETVESLPHYEAVRQDMADLLETYAARGKILTLEQAYNIAAQANGLETVPAAGKPTSTSEAAAILARSRKAASTTAGAPRQSPTAPPTDRRSQIEAAFDQAGL